MPQLLTPRPTAVAKRTGPKSLLVAWQHPQTRTYLLLGRATASADGHFEFEYFPEVEKNVNFRAIPGFGDSGRTYSSTTLFPFFSTRIMSTRRPDRPEWLHKLHVREDAQPFEILAHSFGKRVADTYEIFAEPEVDFAAGTMGFSVPVHGLRYMSAEAKAWVDKSLRRGDTLDVLPEPGNPKDSRAQGIWAGGQMLGFVPAPVLDYLDLMKRPGTFSAEVERVNPESDGTHLRVVMSLRWTELG